MTDFVVAECGIRQLHARYIDAVWRKDAQAYGDCWTADCEFKFLGTVISTRAGIVKWWTPLMEQFDRVIQHYHPPILEVGNGTASGRTYMGEHNRWKDGRVGDTVGCYYERYVDEGDRWRFSFRHIDLYYFGPSDMSGPLLFKIPEVGAPPKFPEADRPAMPSLADFGM